MQSDGREYAYSHPTYSSDNVANVWRFVANGHSYARSTSSRVSSYIALHARAGFVVADKLVIAFYNTYTHAKVENRKRFYEDNLKKYNEDLAIHINREHACEAISLVLAVYLEWLTPEEAARIASISKYESYLLLLNEVMPKS